MVFKAGDYVCAPIGDGEGYFTHVALVVMTPGVGLRGDEAHCKSLSGRSTGFYLEAVLRRIVVSFVGPVLVGAEAPARFITTLITK